MSEPSQPKPQPDPSNDSFINSSPPPGLTAIRLGSPIGYPVHLLDDFVIHPSSPPSGAQRNVRFRFKEGISADAVVRDKRNHEIVCHPKDGRIGFGYYRQSQESRDVINFYPVLGIRRYLRGGKLQEGPTAGRRKEAESKPEPFAFPPPPPEPTEPHIDPNWVAWLEKLKTVDPDTMNTSTRWNLLEQTVGPMVDYIERIQGPEAEKSRTELLGIMQKIHPENPEIRDERFAERRGMLGKEEYMAPVSYRDGVTD